MPRAIRIANLVLLTGALAAGSAAYAGQHTTPSAPDAAPDMMQGEGGDMEGAGMEGMMSMSQMNKMMTLCTKMMEGMMMQMDQQDNGRDNGASSTKGKPI